MRCIFVSDNNPVYLGFWKPQAEHMWKRFGLKSILYFISSESDTSLFRSEYAEVRYIPLLSNVPSIVQALFAKWYFPGYETSEERLFICDIDCFVLSKSFVNYIKEVNTIFHLKIKEKENLPGYYVSGTPQQLRSFFRGDDISFEKFCLRAIRESKHHLPESHVSEFSKAASSDWKYFGSEEHYATECAKIYQDKTDSSFSSPFPNVNRICRSCYSYYDSNRLIKDEYIDYHCPRPYEDYKNVIESILNVANG